MGQYCRNLSAGKIKETSFYGMSLFLLTAWLKNGILSSGNLIKIVGIPKGEEMKLSTRGKYGLYAMYYLALHAGEGPQPLQDISTMGIPKLYLEQILGNLRRAGLVNTVRGQQGGYQLAGKPEDITLLDVMDAVEGPIELSECTSAENNCERSATCPVRWVWQRISRTINDELEKIHLSDMLAPTCESEE